MESAYIIHTNMLNDVGIGILSVCNSPLRGELFFSYVVLGILQYPDLLHSKQRNCDVSDIRQV